MLATTVSITQRNECLEYERSPSVAVLYKLAISVRIVSVTKNVSKAMSV
jgi:hypothetical protein